jgi:hypothetical protein
MFMRTPHRMSILLCILSLNIGIVLGMFLSGILQAQRQALGAHPCSQAEAD